MATFTNPQYSAPDNSTIDAMAVFTLGQTPMPFTANRNDPSTAPYYTQIVAAGGVAAYAAPVLTLAQQAGALLKGGLTVTSTGTGSLSGVYAADATTVGYINSEISSILLNGTFADGTSTVQWPDISGTLHAFSVTQFKSLAAALGVFVSGIRQCVIGVGGASLPSSTATIP